MDQNKWLNIFVWPFLFRKCKWINIRYPSYSIFVPFGKTVFWWSLLVLSKKWIFESEFFWFRKSTSFFRMIFSIDNLGKLIWVEILTSLPILWLSSSLYLGPQKINLLKYVPKWSILFSYQTMSPNTMSRIFYSFGIRIKNTIVNSSLNSQSEIEIFYKIIKKFQIFTIP